MKLRMTSVLFPGFYEQLYDLLVFKNKHVISSFYVIQFKKV